VCSLIELTKKTAIYVLGGNHSLQDFTQGAEEALRIYLSAGNYMFITGDQMLQLYQCCLEVNGIKHAPEVHIELMQLHYCLGLLEENLELSQVNYITDDSGLVIFQSLLERFCRRFFVSDHYPGSFRSNVIYMLLKVCYTIKIDFNWYGGTGKSFFATDSWQMTSPKHS